MSLTEMEQFRRFWARHKEEVIDHRDQTYRKGSFSFGSGSAVLISTCVCHPDLGLALLPGNSPQWTGNIKNTRLIRLIFKDVGSQ